jgi:predicted ATPase
MLAWQFASPSGRLQEFVARQGGANALLHDGAKVTQNLEIKLSFSTAQGTRDYACLLSYAAEDTLIFVEESGLVAEPQKTTVSAYFPIPKTKHHETSLQNHIVNQRKTDNAILDLLRSITVYQFHDTSYNSRIRGKWSASDNRQLKEDGANLAAFLLRLKTDHFDRYRIIVDTIRLIAPFFNDFELEEEHGSILLRWSERETDQVFNASQASDGLLRAMALVALLAQPPEDLPGILIIDEPELGLHPFGISVITGMIHNAARHAQVIVSTQSVPFIDDFEPEDIIVLERFGRESTCKRLDSKSLEMWTDEYSLSELWQKNVLGGRP